MSPPDTIYMDPARIVDGHTYPIRNDVAYVRKDLFDAKGKECAELRKDAERYSWLRTNPCGTSFGMEYDGNIGATTYCNLGQLDDAIDAAMREKP